MQGQTFIKSFIHLLFTQSKQLTTDKYFV